MAQLHLVVMVASFVWSALISYAETPTGAAELADIEAVLQAIENPTQSTSTPTGTSTPASTATSQIIRK
jgi:hypothetical protein